MCLHNHCRLQFAHIRWWNRIIIEVLEMTVYSSLTESQNFTTVSPLNFSLSTYLIFSWAIRGSDFQWTPNRQRILWPYFQNTSKGFWWGAFKSLQCRWVIGYIQGSMQCLYLQGQVVLYSSVTHPVMFCLNRNGTHLVPCQCTNWQVPCGHNFSLHQRNLWIFPHYRSYVRSFFIWYDSL
jgi:hypothetical protein